MGLWRDLLYRRLRVVPREAPPISRVSAQMGATPRLSDLTFIRLVRTSFWLVDEVGHADIRREQLDGRAGKSEQRSAAFQEYDADHRASKHAKAEQAAIARPSAGLGAADAGRAPQQDGQRDEQDGDDRRRY